MKAAHVTQGMWIRRMPPAPQEFQVHSYLNDSVVAVAVINAPLHLQGWEVYNPATAAWEPIER